MIRKGQGLRRNPFSECELEVRAERRLQIEQARLKATEFEQDGRTWKLVRLPDGPAANYPTGEVESDAA